jgi:hypothetical protein
LWGEKTNDLRKTEIYMSSLTKGTHKLEPPLKSGYQENEDEHNTGRSTGAAKRVRICFLLVDYENIHFFCT